VAANPQTLLTVEEFAKIAGSSDDRCELIDGVLITMPPPDAVHYEMQWRLLELLRPHASSGRLGTEAYRPSPKTRRVRIADVGWASAERWRAVHGQLYLPAAPELVIEVLSDSNTAADIMRPQDDAFVGGALEFWAIEMQTRTVTVSRPDSTARTYRPGPDIPLTVLDGGVLPIDDIFMAESRNP
jgi:Uma2 family endonuclease